MSGDRYFAPDAVDLGASSGVNTAIGLLPMLAANPGASLDPIDLRSVFAALGGPLPIPRPDLGQFLGTAERMVPTPPSSSLAKPGPNNPSAQNELPDGAATTKSAVTQDRPAPIPAPDRLPVTLNDGRTVEDPETRQTLLLPPNVSMPDVVSVGRLIGQLPPLFRDAAMLWAFRHGGPLDFQRQPDPNAFNGEYRDIGNYLYGVVSAAAGYSPKDALFGAGWYNQRSSNPDKSDVFQNDRRNAGYIRQGYQDYLFGYHDPAAPKK